MDADELMMGCSYTWIFMVPFPLRINYLYLTPDLEESIMTHIFFVYILHCADGTYYTGYSGNLTRRFKQHQSGSIPRAYTKSRRPVKLVWAGEFSSKDEARAYEKKLKAWSTQRKEQLIAEDKATTGQIRADLGIPD